MSAFVVNPAHITALLAVAMHGPADQATPRNPGASAFSGVFTWYAFNSYVAGNWEQLRLDLNNADAIGQMLWDENRKSVTRRYQPRPALAEALAAAEEPYHYRRPTKEPTIAGALKAIRCLEYQSCEHPEWEQSAAHAFCENLRLRLIEALPGYDDAAWEITAKSAA
ncbi:MAG: hypothetical protein NTZ05_09110 [Chloroflexi bacterium]|nr:hypothetical protein [Chloroflexota bacterium]